MITLNQFDVVQKMAAILNVEFLLDLKLNHLTLAYHAHGKHITVRYRVSDTRLTYLDQHGTQAINEHPTIIKDESTLIDLIRYLPAAIKAFGQIMPGAMTKPSVQLKTLFSLFCSQLESVCEQVSFEDRTGVGDTVYADFALTDWADAEQSGIPGRIQLTFKAFADELHGVRFQVEIGYHISEQGVQEPKHLDLTPYTTWQNVREFICYHTERVADPQKETFLPDTFEEIESTFDVISRMQRHYIKAH